MDSQRRRKIKRTVKGKMRCKIKSNMSRRKERREATISEYLHRGQVILN